MLILASRSPRRQDLLEAAGIAFRVVPPEMEEAPAPPAAGRYADLVRRTALAKAESVARGRRDIVLGADTIVVCERRVFGKPTDRRDARRMLARLSGRWHRVYTGLALLSGERYMLGYECTKVAFRPLANREIGWYVKTGEPLDKAGAYAIQGRGVFLVRAIRGCYTNVVGLPLPKLLKMLADFKQGAGAARRLPPGGC